MRFAFGREFYFAVRQSEQSVIFADADIFAGQNIGAALADDNRTGPRFVALGDFDAEIFRI